MSAGLSLITDRHHAKEACREMLDILAQFVMWRAKVHFNHQHLETSQLRTFVTEYCKDKMTALEADLHVIGEELFYTSPSVQSEIYVSVQVAKYMHKHLFIRIM